MPTQILVVDNNSTDHTADVVKVFQKKGLSIQRVVEAKIGFPYVYNRGLRRARDVDWVCFIDDDCVAEPDWYMELTEGIHRHSRSAAVMGMSLTMQTQSLWSLAVWSFDQIWKQAGLAQHQSTSGDYAVINHEILDNKNIAYNQKFLQQFRIKFNETAVVEDGVGAAEDADLGMQISSHGGSAWFLPKAVVSHLDPTSFLWFCKKIIASARAVRLYRDRWHQQSDSRGFNPQGKGQPNLAENRSRQRFRLLRQWLFTSTRYHLSYVQRFGLFVVMVLGAFLFALVYMCTCSKKLRI